MSNVIDLDEHRAPDLDDLVWTCMGCGSIDFNLFMDQHIECAQCDAKQIDIRVVDDEG